MWLGHFKWGTVCTTEGRQAWRLLDRPPKDRSSCVQGWSGTTEKQLWIEDGGGAPLATCTKSQSRPREVGVVATWPQSCPSGLAEEAAVECFTVRGEHRAWRLRASASHSERGLGPKRTTDNSELRKGASEGKMDL